jgi:hypothetical protein
VEYFQIKNDQYLCCSFGCGRTASILQVDQGDQQLVCNEHTYHTGLPQSLPQGHVNSLPHMLNPRSAQNQFGVI